MLGWLGASGSPAQPTLPQTICKANAHTRAKLARSCFAGVGACSREAIGLEPSKCCGQDGLNRAFISVTFARRGLGGMRGAERLASGGMCPTRGLAEAEWLATPAFQPESSSYSAPLPVTMERGPRFTRRFRPSFQSQWKLPSNVDLARQGLETGAAIPPSAGNPVPNGPCSAHRVQLVGYCEYVGI